MRIRTLTWLVLCFWLVAALGMPAVSADAIRRTPGLAPGVASRPVATDGPNRPIAVRIEGFVANLADPWPSEMVVQVYDGANTHDVAILVTEQTIISQDPTIPSGEPLSVGDLVLVRATFDGAQYLAQSVHVLARRKAVEFRGIIEDIDLDLKEVNGKSCQWMVVSGTSVYVCDRDPVPPAKLYHYAYVKGFLEPGGMVRADDLQILGRPEEIARRFEYQGALRVVSAIPGDWTVGPFTGWVDDDTEIVGVMVSGAMVEVQGRRLEGGALRFDTIKRVDPAAFVRVQGMVREVVLQRGPAFLEGHLLIEGEARTIMIDAETLLDESGGRLAPGMWAEVVARPFGETLLQALRVRISRSG